MRCANCPVAPGLACLGERHGRLCELAATDEAYRAELTRIASGSPSPEAAGLRRVNACPHRGPVLPHTQQPECGCAELTACSASRGKRPGAVTLRECLDCKTMA